MKHEKQMERPTRELLIRYFLGKCAQQEHRAIDLYLAMKQDDDYVESCLQEAFFLQEEMSDTDLERKERVWRGLNIRQTEFNQLEALPKANKILRFPQIAAAVAILLLALAVTWNIFQYSESLINANWLATRVLVKPGADRAVLTLADGSVVPLDDLHNGQIAQQAGVSVEKTASGEIVYHAPLAADGTAVSGNNTVATPRGGQFTVVLPDGSTAKLNAASSLSYPIKFDASARHVKMTGEVYFVVKKLSAADGSQRIPFVVETQKQTVQVLGTSFNVNAYPDEPSVRTSLLEGLVRVVSSNSGKSTLLQPGQEAIVNDDITVNTMDSKEALAWVNGDFVFQKEELSSILRKIARWYDVEVECPEDLGRIRFSGMLSRQQPLAEIIETIAAMEKVKLSLAGRRITVTQ